MLQPFTDGRLIYAVGDVHGRLDLLSALIAHIAADALESQPFERPLLVLLGDYVDRGAQSAGVLDLVLTLKSGSAFEFRALKGNHEEAVLNFLDDPAVGPEWELHGGGATLSSYGVEPPPPGAPPEVWAQTRDAFAAALPPAHLALLRSLELMFSVGSYVFVHAGVRPDQPLNQQTEHDLLWIRRDFLESEGPFEKVVVHGHTPAEAPQITPQRIGVDTGAYATGVLTAVRLHDHRQSIMQASLGSRAAA